MNERRPSPTPGDASPFALAARRAASRSAVSAPHRITLTEAVGAVRFFGEPILEEIRLRVSRERLAHTDLPRVLNLGETAWALCLNRWTVRDLLVRRRLRGRQAISGKYIVWRVELEDVQSWAMNRETAYGKKNPLWDLI